MALLSELVKRIAEAEGLDQTFAAGAARYLREAGLISQAGRGRGAAKMTSRDAAILIIGLNVSRVAKSAPEETQIFMTQTQSWKKASGFYGVCSEGNTLAQDIERLIDLASEGVLSSDFMKRKLEIGMQFHMPIKYTMLWVKENLETPDDEEPRSKDLCSGLYGSVWPPKGSWLKQPDRTDMVVLTARTVLAAAEQLKT